MNEVVFFWVFLVIYAKAQKGSQAFKHRCVVFVFAEHFKCNVYISDSWNLLLVNIQCGG